MSAAAPPSPDRELARTTAMPAPRRRASGIWVAAAALLLAGCEARFDGLRALLDASPEYVAFPGEQLESGTFSGPSFQGTRRTGAHLVAFRYAPEPRLLVRPLSGGAACETGLATAYQYFLHLPSTPLEPFVPVVEPDGLGGEQLSFYDLRCERPIEPLPTGRLPQEESMLLEDPPRYLVFLEDGAVTLVSPWEREILRSPDPVTKAELVGERIFTLEREQVVVRDLALKELARLGTRVTEFTVTSYGPSEVAFIDDGKLYAAQVDEWKPELLDEDACHLAVPSGWEGSGVSYFSPCDDARLVLLWRQLDRRSDGGVPLAEQRYEISDGVLTAPTVVRLPSGRVVLFEARGEAEGVRALWSSSFKSDPKELGAPERVGDDAKLSETRRLGAGVRLLLDWTGATGNIVYWQPGESPRTLASDVAEVEGNLLLADYDGSSGTLLSMRGEEASVVARGVPRDSLLIEDEGVALLTDYDGSSGTLLAKSTQGANGLETIAERVHPGSYGFMLNMRAIVYVQDHDDALGGGRLGVRTLDSADRFEVEGPVAEWDETGWPSVGLLYVVGAGPLAGIWFAKAK